MEKRDNKIVYAYRSFEVPAGVVRSCPQGGTARIAFRIDRPAKDYVGNEYGCVYKYVVTFAFCSPLDNFSRRGARSLTSTRAFLAMDSNDIHAREFAYIITSPEKLRIQEIVDYTIENMALGNVKAPNWLKAVL